MIRGTATQWKCVFKYTKDQIQDVMIMFWQPNNPSESLPIIKRKYDCAWNDSATNECYVSLRPSETALFSDKYRAKMQVKVTPNAEFGLPFGSKENLITVYPMPDNMMPDDPTPEDPEDVPIPPDGEWAYLDGGSIIV